MIGIVGNGFVGNAVTKTLETRHRVKSMTRIRIDHSIH